MFYGIPNFLRLLTPFNFSNPIVPRCCSDIIEGGEPSSGVLSYSPLGSLKLVQSSHNLECSKVRWVWAFRGGRRNLTVEESSCDIRKGWNGIPNILSGIQLWREQLGNVHTF